MQQYSKENFIQRTESEGELQMLSEALGNEIQRRLHPTILSEMEAIVSDLNALGHNLKLRYEPFPGDIHYRDWSKQHCDLLVACDTVISVAFRKAIEE